MHYSAAPLLQNLSALTRQTTSSRGRHRMRTAATTRERLIPHTIVPPCSGPSRCGLETSEYISAPTRFDPPAAHRATLAAQDGVDTRCAIAAAVLLVNAPDVG
jgi:hypothetical protein